MRNSQKLRCLLDTLSELSKVVIIGQDPYHGQGQAHGLCFSVQKGVQIPPSLRNMIQELKVIECGSFNSLGAELLLHFCCSDVDYFPTLESSIVNLFLLYLQDDSANNVKTTTHGNLECWAKQGVLMLNTCMTVRNGMANSHQNKGWETFTDAVVKQLAAREGIVYLLWGNPAQAKYESSLLLFR